MRTGTRTGPLRGAFLLGSLLVTLVGAAPPSSQLQDFFGRCETILNEATDSGQAREEVRRLVQALFDVPSATRQALGPAWAALSAGEREEFVSLFGDLLQRAYLDMIQARLPQATPPVIRFLGHTVRTGERAAVVHTAVRAKDGSDVRFDYIMARVGDTWLVHDVMVDGVSLVDNYRAQFARTLRTVALAGLMARLRAVVARNTLTAASAGGVSPPWPGTAYFSTGGADVESRAVRALEDAAAWLRARGDTQAVVARDIPTNRGIPGRTASSPNVERRPCEITWWRGASARTGSP